MKTKPASPSAQISQSENELGRAIIANDPKRIRALLKNGVSPDAVIWRWSSALYLAVHLRRVPCARVLLLAGASPHPKQGRVPLVAAIRQDIPEIAQRLLSSGAEVDARCSQDELTPLEVAIILNRPALVSLLCRAGANLKRPTARFPALGQWPEHLPENWDVLTFLYRVRRGRQLLAMEAWRGHDIPSVRLSRSTPLALVALSVGAKRCARILLAHGADRSARDSTGHGWDDYVRVYGKRRTGTSV